MPSFSLELKKRTKHSKIKFFKARRESELEREFSNRLNPYVREQRQRIIVRWMNTMGFPERVYTVDEVKRARVLIAKGYKHRLRVVGSQDFKCKVKEALKLIKAAKYYSFLRTYIRQIREIGGLSQLREAEVAIWANKYAVADPIEAAGFIIQKAQQMKDFIEGKLYYDKGEMGAVEKRIEFLETLRDTSKNQAVKKKCEENLKRWGELTFP